jgi:glucose/arabinose dehydrogenase
MRYNSAFGVPSTLSREIKELIALTIIILAISLLVFPGIMPSRGQQQEPSPSVQQSLTQQATEISQQQVSNDTTTPVPILNNSKLELELVTEGLDSPTSMAFIGNHHDILILEKSGEVVLFSNDNKTKIPFVNFTINQQSERGLLGVAVLANNMSNADRTAATTTAASNNNERY